MSIDTYPPQSTQATVVVTETIQWVSRLLTTGAASNAIEWTDSLYEQKTAFWRVPEQYAGGALTLRVRRRAGGTGGAARMDYTVARTRADAAAALIVASTDISYTPADTLTREVTVTVAADLFVRGDNILFNVNREGTHASDTLVGVVYCDDIAVTYNAYVMGYAAYPASVNNASYEEGSFTVTATGFTAAVTGTARYIRAGKLTVVMFPVLSGTSNATSFTLTGIPAALTPVITTVFPAGIADNGASFIGLLNVTGVVWFLTLASGAGFTASGTKLINATTVTYHIA